MVRAIQCYTKRLTAAMVLTQTLSTVTLAHVQTPLFMCTTLLESLNPAHNMICANCDTTN